MKMLYMHYQTFFLRNLMNNTFLLFAAVISALVKSAYQKKKKKSYFSTKTYVVGTHKNRLNEPKTPV